MVKAPRIVCKKSWVLIIRTRGSISLKSIYGPSRSCYSEDVSPGINFRTKHAVVNVYIMTDRSWTWRLQDYDFLFPVISCRSQWRKKKLISMQLDLVAEPETCHFAFGSSPCINQKVGRHSSQPMKLLYLVYFPCSQHAAVYGLGLVI